MKLKRVLEDIGYWEAVSDDVMFDRMLNIYIFRVGNKLVLSE